MEINAGITNAKQPSIIEAYSLYVEEADRITLVYAELTPRDEQKQFQTSSRIVAGVHQPRSDVEVIDVEPATESRPQRPVGRYK